MARTITRLSERPPVAREASETRFDVPSLNPTRNDLPEPTRAQVVMLLNQRLADAIDLQT